MEQGSELWHAWRKKGLGSSESSVIMGVDPYRTKEQLFLDKTGRGIPVKVNPAMLLGQKFEEPARALLFFEFGYEFEPIVCVNPDFPFIKASLDGYSSDHDCFVELKYMGQANFELVKGAQAPLPHHFPQVQHQFLAKGARKAFYATYTLTKDKSAIDQIQVIPVLRDNRYIQDELLPALKSFWGEVTSWTEKNQSSQHLSDTQPLPPAS